MAEAHAQLALGNVALAQEHFRKAERERPGTVDALAGIANCYERMGRFDLTRLYYERALASAPTDATLIASFAGSLERQGLLKEAARLRQESHLRRVVSVEAVIQKLREVEPFEGSFAQTARPAIAVAEAAVGAKTKPTPNKPVRLERLSMTEVALITSARLRWSTVTKVRAPESLRISGSPDVRLLNAARHPGLAAQARLSLQRRGWAKLAIGDAPKVRHRSVVLYSAQDYQKARQLARQLGVTLALDPRPGRITVLLGRDAVALISGIGT